MSLELNGISFEETPLAVGGSILTVAEGNRLLDFAEWVAGWDPSHELNFVEVVLGRGMLRFDKTRVRKALPPSKGVGWSIGGDMPAKPWHTDDGLKDGTSASSVVVLADIPKASFAATKREVPTGVASLRVLRASLIREKDRLREIANSQRDDRAQESMLELRHKLEICCSGSREGDIHTGVRKLEELNNSFLIYFSEKRDEVQDLINATVLQINRVLADGLSAEGRVYLHTWSEEGSVLAMANDPIHPEAKIHSKNPYLQEGDYSSLVVRRFERLSSLRSRAVPGSYEVLSIDREKVLFDPTAA